MSAIKRFFEKKKLQLKFKKLGEGHSLTGEPSRAPAAPSFQPQPRVSGSRGQTEEQQRAAEAALGRLSAPKSGTVKQPKTGSEAIKAQVARELEKERKLLQDAERLAASYAAPKERQLEAAKLVQETGGVTYHCELIPGLFLPRKQMEERIKQFLEEQIKEDAEMASALMIHTVNKDPAKVKVCIDTLCTYIDNLLNHPGEEKFRKIRVGNKAFQDRVASLAGGTQFLLCAGYRLTRLPYNNGDDDFYVISAEAAAEIENLNHLKETLTNAEPIQAELHRALRVFHCTTPAGQRFGEIPNDFYNISKEELAREQQARQDAVEKLGMLRTKAMRERDEMRELRKYRYTLIRVRLPGDIFLQAIYKSTETLGVMISFIREQLEYDWMPFAIRTANGQVLQDESKTLAELQLVPACLVNLDVDKQTLSDANRQSGNKNLNHILHRGLENCVAEL